MKQCPETCFSLFYINLSHLRNSPSPKLAIPETRHPLQMKAFNFFLLSALVILVSLQLIAADSDMDDSTVSQRASNRQDNRVGRRQNRQTRRHSVWQDIKNWFKVGHQRRESRRFNRKLNRQDRRAGRQGRRNGRQDNRQNRRDDFFSDSDW